MGSTTTLPPRPLGLPASVTIDPMVYSDWIYAFYRGHLDMWPSAEEISIHYYAYMELAETGEQEAGKQALRGVLPDAVVFYPEWLPRSVRRHLPRRILRRMAKTPDWVGLK